MKRIVTTTALALCAALSLPAVAQQAPPSNNAPNPSAPPTEGNPPSSRSTMPSATGGTMGSSDTNMQRGSGTDSTSSMSSSDTKKKKKSGTTHRSKKPRQQGMPDAVTPDSPSAPKGDSPSPAPTQ